MFHTISKFYETQSFKQQNKLKHQCAWLSRLEVLNKVTFMMGVTINGLPTVIFEDLTTVFIYGVPNTLLFAFWAYYLYMSIDIPFIFFYIICKYLYFKIRTLNQAIIELNGKQRTTRIRNILQAFDTTYRELKKYNSMYWSKFLFIIWFFCGSGIVFLTYIACFEPIRVEMQIVCIYGAITEAMLYLYIILTASSITYQTKRTYKILNSLYVRISMDRIRTISKTQKLKTCYKVNFK